MGGAAGTGLRRLTVSRAAHPALNSGVKRYCIRAHTRERHRRT